MLPKMVVTPTMELPSIMQNLQLRNAVSIAQSGTVIKVLSGNYVEANPITLPAFTAVVGDDLRTVKVLPSTPTSDIFHVNKACKLANMTFSGHVAPAAAVAFPTGIATNVGGGKMERSLYSKLYQ